MLFCGVAEVALLHWWSTWLTVERVVVREGVLRKKPAPAKAAPAKKDTPRRRRGWKPAVRVSSMEGVEAVKGRAVMAVWSLEEA